MCIYVLIIGLWYILFLYSGHVGGMRCARRSFSSFSAANVRSGRSAGEVNINGVVIVVVVVERNAE